MDVCAWVPTLCMSALESTCSINKRHPLYYFLLFFVFFSFFDRYMYAESTSVVTPPRAIPCFLSVE